jgi:hypothetical protein
MSTEAIFVIIMLLIIIGSAYVTKRWFLFGTFLLFAVLFGLMELWSIKATGMSISQDFWKYTETHKTGGWLIIGGMFLGWMGLLYHLAYKNLLKKGKK